MDAELRRLAENAGLERFEGAWSADRRMQLEDQWNGHESQLAEFAALVAEHLSGLVWADGRVAFSEYHQGRENASQQLAAVATGWRSPRTPEG